jgi:AcrR family transcriptional regulator
MTSRAWTREDQADAAVEKILEAADKAFVELGVSATGMAEVASFAGCSRGTLYRYFKNRHELHLAYVKRMSREIHRCVHERVEAIEDPAERLVEYILETIREVRENPATAAWFEVGVAGLAARMSRAAEIVETLTFSFVPDLPGAVGDRADQQLRKRWLVRIVLSLLMDPAASSSEERAVVERFIVPSVTAGSEILDVAQKTAAASTRKRSR